MKNHTEIINALDEALKVKDNFDIIKRELLIQDKKLVFYCVDGFVKDEVLEKMMEFILKADLASMENNGLQVLANQLVSYVETDVSKDFQQMITAVLSGSVLLIIEGYEKGIVIDARTYPTRGMQEPEDDRVLRGSRDGFVETLVFNDTAQNQRCKVTNGVYKCRYFIKNRLGAMLYGGSRRS